MNPIIIAVIVAAVIIIVAIFAIIRAAKSPSGQTNTPPGQNNTSYDQSKTKIVVTVNGKEVEYTDAEWRAQMEKDEAHRARYGPRPANAEWAYMNGYNIVPMYPQTDATINLGQQADHIDCEEACQGSDGCVAWTWWGDNTDSMKHQCYGTKSYDLQRISEKYVDIKAGIRRRDDVPDNRPTTSLITAAKMAPEHRGRKMTYNVNFFAAGGTNSDFATDDLPDGMFEYTTKKSAEACEAACLRQDSCRAWTYKEKGAGAGRCVGSTVVPSSAYANLGTHSGQVFALGESPSSMPYYHVYEEDGEKKRGSLGNLFDVRWVTHNVE